MSSRSKNGHMEGVAHPPLVLGEKFHVEMQPVLQDDLQMSYPESRQPLESPTAQAENVLEMLWYFKIKGQTVTLLDYDSTWWRLGLSSVMFPGSSLGLRKRSDQLSFTHLSEHLCPPCLLSTLHIA